MAPESAPKKIERRKFTRLRPAYSPEELSALHILQVYFRQNTLFCLLADGKTLCLPLAAFPPLAGAEPVSKYQWQLQPGGKTITWHTKDLNEELKLVDLISHPLASICELPRL